jgi:MoxR-like ATPase
MQKTPCNCRLHGKDLVDAVRGYNDFFDGLKGCFVGRDRVIDNLRFAMLQKQHLLTFGPPGTSKTAIFDVLYSGLTDVNGFHAELSMFMTEDALFGPYNPKKMREEGVLEHNVSGMLPEANVARLGEFLDANMPLLRSTLSALNERRMVRGRQHLTIPLITAYCDTNTDPGTFLERHPEAWAVLDRFLFMAYVDYLSDPDEITEMLVRFQCGNVTNLTSRLSINVINELSRLTLEPPTIIKSELIMRKMAQGMQAYRIERRAAIRDEKLPGIILPEISDRRLCWATQVAEANAILNARDEVVPEDILALKQVLGTTIAEEEMWTKIATRLIEEIKEEQKMQLDNAQYIALEGLMKEIEQIEPVKAGNIDDLKQLGQALMSLKQQTETITPENDHVAALSRKALVVITEKSTAIKNQAAHFAGMTN